MAGEGEPAAPGATRVAIVVAAGVGDSPRGEAARRVANGLVGAGFGAPEQYAEWYPVAGGVIQPLDRFALRSADSRYAVDVYEYWWADLSRFPAALRSFVAAFFGLFLALPAVGRKALSDAGPVRREPQALPPEQDVLRRLDYHLLGVVEWLVGVPVVVATAVLLMGAGALSIALGLRGSGDELAWTALALYGAALAVTGLMLLHRYERDSRRSPALLLSVAALLLAAGICVWRIFERGGEPGEVRGLELALADTVLWLAAYPLRLTWLLVLGAAALCIAALAMRLLVDHSRWRRTITAMVTIGVGPLGVATLMGIISAAVGALGQKVSKNVDWTATTGFPWCLDDPADWRVAECAPEDGVVNAWSWGAQLLAQNLISLAYACTVALFLALLFATVFLLLGAGHLRGSSDPAVRANRQAAATSLLLRLLDNGVTAVLLLVAGIAACYAAAAAWLPFVPLPFDRGWQWTPTIAAITGYGVTTLAITARFIGLGPGQLARGGKASEAVRALLDRPYDVATFLREPVGFQAVSIGGRDRHVLGQTARAMPRQRMLNRYQALLEHLARPEKAPYDRIVFVAHSQGTVLTTALLAEDGVPLPPEVSLMTFGCPLRQLYLQRFPAQFAWVGGLADLSTRTSFVRAVTREWVNVPAAGDLIGRTVFIPPPSTWASGSAWPQPPAGSPQLEELEIGAGGHGSYWTARPLYERLAAMIVADHEGLGEGSAKPSPLPATQPA